MSRALTIVVSLLVLLVGCHTHVKNPRSPEAQAEIEDARRAFLQKDAGLERFFDGAHGYVLFPNVGKGGLIFGGGGGRGYVFERGNLIGTAKLSFVSVGAQIGGQAFREVIFFENKDNLDHFKRGNFEIGSQLSAVAANTGASKNARYEKGVAIFTVAVAGLMAEASVSGQKFKFYPLPAQGS